MTANTLLFFSDSELDATGASNTRFADICTLMNGQTYDRIVFGGDMLHDWTVAEQNDFDTRFNIGTLKANTDAIPGNHEYSTGGEGDFYNYWGTHAGSSSTTMWHSFDMPNGWHVIMLDMTTATGAPGCAAGSAQYTWLQNDLDSRSGVPTLCVWHAGRYSGGSGHGNNTGASDAFALLLTRPWVEAVLSGHNMLYERFARMNNAGAVDTVNGIRQFTAPACGHLSAYTETAPTGLEASSSASNIGVIRFVLDDDRYSWSVLTPGGYTAISDTGTQLTRYTLARTSGPRYPTSSRTIAGGQGAWTNLANAGADDAAVAVWTVP